MSAQHRVEGDPASAMGFRPEGGAQAQSGKPIAGATTGFSPAASAAQVPAVCVSTRKAQSIRSPSSVTSKGEAKVVIVSKKAQRPGRGCEIQSQERLDLPADAAEAPLLWDVRITQQCPGAAPTCRMRAPYPAGSSGACRATRATGCRSGG